MNLHIVNNSNTIVNSGGNKEPESLKSESMIKKDSFKIGINNNNLNTAGTTKKGLLKGFGITGGIVITVFIIIALISYVFLVRPSIVIMNDVSLLKEDLKHISESLTRRDLVELDKNILATNNDLNRLQSDRDKNFGWVRNLKLFKINEFYSDSDRFINAGRLSLDALKEAEKLVIPFASAAGLRVQETDEVKTEMSLMDSFKTWVGLMPQVSDQMDGVLAILTEIGEELAPIDTTKYPESIRGVPIRANVEFAKNTLVKVKDYGPDIKLALKIVPSLLGVESPIAKRYMIIMQNDKEIRPTGGFWTNYATFKIKDGLLDSTFTSKDFYSIDYAIDVIDQYYDFPSAPPAYTKYLKVERWYARDTNSSPDLPTSVNNFMTYYNLGIRYAPTEIKPIDGIITIDTKVIEELLDITGPVTLNGVTYNSQNVVLELERIASLTEREQLNRKGVLGNLMAAMLKNVFESQTYLWSKLIDKGVDLAIRKHIQAFVFDAPSQQLIEKYNLGGRITDPVDGDYSYVVSTNLGGDKTNWFVTKQVNHDLAKEGDKWVDTVKVTYKYEKPADDYAPFVKRFRDWIRVYAPLGSQQISITGSEDGTGTGEERNKTYFSAYVELGPDETKELTFKYYLPENTIKNGVYNLSLQKQPGIETETHTVSVLGKTSTIELIKDEVFSTKVN